MHVGLSAFLIGALVVPHDGGEAAAEKTFIEAPVVYRDLMLVLVGKDGIGAITFAEETAGKYPGGGRSPGVKYRYRF